MIGTSYYRRSTTTVVVGTVALLLNNPANGSLGVFGFTNARRQLHSTTSTTSKLTLNAATIDAAEVLDSSSSISDRVAWQRTNSTLENVMIPTRIVGCFKPFQRL